MSTTAQQNQQLRDLVRDFVGYINACNSEDMLNGYHNNLGDSACQPYGSTTYNDRLKELGLTQLVKVNELEDES